MVALAEMWRQRWRFGVPIAMGILLGVFYTLNVPRMYEARATLQVQSEQTHSPLLRKLTAPGQEAILRQFLLNPQLLADTGHDAGITIKPQDVLFTIVNDHLIGIGYRSSERQGLEQAANGLAFNFIQAVLAPERIRIEENIVQTKQELKEISGRLATSDGLEPSTRSELQVRQTKLQNDLVDMQSEQRLVNVSAGNSQALIWFAEVANLVPPMENWLRMTINILLGGLLGALYGFAVHKAPRVKNRAVASQDDASTASGMPLVGTLPWLGKLRTSQGGLYVQTGGKQLRPSEFSELSRLQRTLVRNLRGPLVLLGVSGNEGVTSLALLLAERTASQGKTVALVDMNLKNRGLSQDLGLGDGNWEVPAKGKGGAKARWDALHSLPGQPNLKVLAAPRHPETLSKLGEAGGLPALFDLLTEMADIVIVDASPLAAMNRGNVDAVAVAAASSRTLLVAQSERTGASDLKRATDSLLLVGAPLLGIVLNQQFSLSRRQLLGQLADHVAKVLPPLASLLRKASINVKD